MNKLQLLLLALMLLVSYGCDSETIEDNLPDPSPYIPPVKTEVKYPIIAHRGSWFQNGLPQNSMAALREALSLEIFGSECDVWKAKDGVLVISHDKMYSGLDITKSTYEQLAQIPLSNGEILPTLDDFLVEVGNSPTITKLVIELKSNATVNDVLDAVNRRGLIGKVIFITYSYSKCQAFAQKGYGDITYFVGHSHTPEEVKNDGIGGFYYGEQDMRNEGKVDWVNWAKDVGVQLILGSVTSPQIMFKYIEEGCLFSSNKPVTLVQAIDAKLNEVAEEESVLKAEDIIIIR